MSNVPQIVSRLIDDYEASINSRQVTIAEAIEITTLLMANLRDTLSELQQDARAGENKLEP